MSEQNARDLLHGVTLEMIVTRLVEYYGWDELGKRINIRCFNNDPSIKSSLKFLRKTPWARKKVEDLYIDTQWHGWANMIYTIFNLVYKRKVPNTVC